MSEFHSFFRVPTHSDWVRFVGLWVVRFHIVPLAFLGPRRTCSQCVPFSRYLRPVRDVPAEKWSGLQADIYSQHRSIATSHKPASQPEPPGARERARARQCFRVPFYDMLWQDLARSAVLFQPSPSPPKFRVNWAVRTEAICITSERSARSEERGASGVRTAHKQIWPSRNGLGSLI